VRIYNAVARVIRIAKAEGVPPHVAADRMAERRIERCRKARTIHGARKKSAVQEIELLLFLGQEDSGVNCSYRPPRARLVGRSSDSSSFFRDLRMSL